MIYSISYNTLNRELKRALESRSLSEEELREVSDRIREENRKKEKTIFYVLIFVGVLFAVMMVMTYLHNHDLDLLKFMIPLMIGVYAIICLLVYFLQTGLLKAQFNRALKKGYPELAEELKL